MGWTDDNPWDCEPAMPEAPCDPSVDSQMEEPDDFLPRHEEMSWREESDLNWSARLKLPVWEYKRLTPDQLEARMELWRSGALEGNKKP